MNYLRSGETTQAKFDLLLSGTSIESAEIISAMRYHLVMGMSKGNAAEFAGIPQGNLNRALDSLNKIATICERYKEMDWVQFKAEQSAILLAK